jgi:hypothetical protein
MHAIEYCEEHKGPTKDCGCVIWKADERDSKVIVGPVSVRSTDWLSEWRGWTVWLEGREAPFPAIFKTRREAQICANNKEQYPNETARVIELRAHSDNNGGEPLP